MEDIVLCLLLALIIAAALVFAALRAVAVELGRLRNVIEQHHRPTPPPPPAGGAAGVTEAEACEDEDGNDEYDADWWKKGRR